jgi:hypothetical protein
MSTVHSAAGLVPRAMLWCASAAVPRVQREGWLDGWNSELWYVSRGEDSSGIYERERRAAVFCLGAFRDAWCLRCEHKEAQPQGPVPRTSRSAVQCAATLAIVLACSMGVGLLVPNVRSVIRHLPDKSARDIIVISPSGDTAIESPLIRMRQFRLWRKRSQRMFSDFAFYAETVKPVRVGSKYTPDLTIASASSNLFSVAHLKPIEALEDKSGLPMLFVSEAIWQREFHGDSSLLGSTVQVGLRRVELAGVVSKAEWELPGTFDAWLLEPDFHAVAIDDSVRGHVIAHMVPSFANRAMGEHWHMTAPGYGKGLDQFACLALSVVERAPFSIYVFTVLLALLALPATTSIPLGEYPVHREGISWPIRLRRWMFLGAKFALLVPAIYFASLDLSYGFANNPVTVEYLQIGSTFVMGLFGFRWALKDQRKRCPVCLRMLTSPARVGEPSRSFLGWNGTELICAGGHGLLHVPELPTSWFATQRWLYLDSSWNGVFLGTI